MKRVPQGGSAIGGVGARLRQLHYRDWWGIQVELDFPKSSDQVAANDRFLAWTCFVFLDASIDYFESSGVNHLVRQD
ncbi:MAG TPA: hypothetical protein V6C65_39225, partial [Allocoleopsis sp.]